MVDRVLALPEGTRLYLLAPIARGRKGEYRKDFAELMKKGFARVKVDGKFHEIAEVPALDKQVKHDIDVVVDRVVVRPDASARLADSFETALQLSDGIAVAEFADQAPASVAVTSPLAGEVGAKRREEGKSQAQESRLTPLPSPPPQGGREKAATSGEAERIIFSAKFACPVSGFTIEEIEPRLFSFNNPYGACPECDGLGTELFFEPDLIVPDENSQPRARRHRALGAHLGDLALLPADARSSGARLSPAHDQAVEVAAEGFPRRGAVRLGRGRDHFHL